MLVDCIDRILILTAHLSGAALHFDEEWILDSVCVMGHIYLDNRVMVIRILSLKNTLKHLGSQEAHFTPLTMMHLKTFKKKADKEKRREAPSTFKNVQKETLSTINKGNIDLF